MLFDLQEDLGWRITAYIVPDSGGSTPSLRVVHEDKELITIEASQPLPSLVSAGRHTTGLCGFVIDEAHIPGLAGLTELELIEPNTGMMIYRRPPRNAIEGIKMFRLETHLLPLWRLDEALNPQFHRWYKGIDRYGRETTTQVFCLGHAKSLYVSGRILYKNYEYYLRNGISTFGVIRHPYNELAERLLVLQRLGIDAERILGSRDALVFAPVMHELERSGPLDEASCRALFRGAPRTFSEALANPLVRQLTAATPDEAASRSGVASSLEVLSSFSLIGMRTRVAEFKGALAEILGVEEAIIPPVGEHDRVVRLAEELRAIPEIESILAQDLEVFDLVLGAFAAVDANEVVNAANRL